MQLPAATAGRKSFWAAAAHRTMTHSPSDSGSTSMHSYIPITYQQLWRGSRECPSLMRLIYLNIQNINFPRANASILNKFETLNRITRPAILHKKLLNPEDILKCI